jgi:hypothetical protein
VAQAIDPHHGIAEIHEIPRSGDCKARDTVTYGAGSGKCRLELAGRPRLPRSVRDWVEGRDVLFEMVRVE